MLSVLLAKHDVRNIVLEQEESVNTDPRGIALDEDGIRCLQACGIYDKVFIDIGKCMLCAPISAVLLCAWERWERERVLTL